MIFLIDYDRKPAKLVSLRAFENSERTAAQDAKLQLELALHREGIQREVVLIDADSEQELRRGYRRYFEDLPTLIRSAIQTLESRQIG